MEYKYKTKMVCSQEISFNINGDVKASDVADEVENRLAGQIVSKGIA